MYYYNSNNQLAATTTVPLHGIIAASTIFRACGLGDSSCNGLEVEVCNGFWDSTCKGSWNGWDVGNCEGSCDHCSDGYCVWTATVMDWKEEFMMALAMVILKRIFYII